MADRRAAAPVGPGPATAVDSCSGAPGPAAAVPVLFQARYCAGDSATRAILSGLVTALAEAGVDPDDRATCELVLAETLNNVCEHAYAEGSGPVELTVALGRMRLLCTVSDQGRPLPAGLVTDPAEAAAPSGSPGAPGAGQAGRHPVDAMPGALPEGGFGWHIIRCLTSRQTYRREGGWNRLEMDVPLSGLD